MVKRTMVIVTVTLLFVFYCFSAYAKDGMTWSKIDVNDTYGVIYLGCGYTKGVGNQCNPYTGDTSCEAELPLLCFYDAGLGKPVNLKDSTYRPLWSGGIVATTDRVKGSSFTTIADANAYCAQKFGVGWRVAEFHESWGWYFKAYGNVGNNWNQSNRRFWVDIDDQVYGTCWGR